MFLVFIQRPLSQRHSTMCQEMGIGGEVEFHFFWSIDFLPAFYCKTNRYSVITVIYAILSQETCSKPSLHLLNLLTVGKRRSRGQIGNPHIGPIPIIIPLKLFLDLPRDTVFPRRLSDSQSYAMNFTHVDS